MVGVEPRRVTRALTSRAVADPLRTRDARIHTVIQAIARAAEAHIIDRDQPVPRVAASTHSPHLPL